MPDSDGTTHDSDGDVVLIAPYVDTEGYVSTGLYALSEALCERDRERQHFGLLGGEYGYGQDFVNETFEMFPFWWGDCECGHTDTEVAWCDAHDHANDCYQAELRRRLDAVGIFEWDDARKTTLTYEERRAAEDRIYRAMTREFGLPMRGCAVHCTCDYQPSYVKWASENKHDERCPTVRPNFKHFASGYEVRWYKYIGRSQEANREVTYSEFAEIMADCLRSLGVE